MGKDPLHEDGRVHERLVHGVLVVAGFVGWEHARVEVRPVFLSRPFLLEFETLYPSALSLCVSGWE